MRLQGTAALTSLVLATLIASAGTAEGASLHSPTLRPAFDPANPSYTVSCERKVGVRIRAREGALSRIDGRRLRGSGERRVGLRPNRAFTVRLDGRSYTLRCLPEDFPHYSFRSLRPATTGMFVLTPAALGSAGDNYVVIFNRHGAPVWWRKTSPGAIDGKVLPDRTIAYSTYYGGGYGIDERMHYEIVDPRQRLLREVAAVGSISDHHDLRLTSDGDYLILSYRQRPGTIDTSAYNGDSEAEVLDAVVQKVSASGKLLWQWSSADHFGPEETASHWWDELSEPYDLFHANSVDELPSGDLLLSMRHTDALYRIDGESGAVRWKLGGEPTSRSLQVIGDPNPSHPFGGQHDARMPSNSTLTVFDNGSDLLGHPARAAHFRIDGRRRTATLLEARTDERAPSSNCCGSARLVGDSWLISWGGQNMVAS
jgi:hypothetical protein